MHDPAREARRWLAAGREDLDVARLVADHGRAAHACFLAQQAAEKAVKALHYGRARFQRAFTKIGDDQARSS